MYYHDQELHGSYETLELHYHHAIYVALHGCSKEYRYLFEMVGWNKSKGSKFCVFWGRNDYGMGRND